MSAVPQKLKPTITGNPVVSLLTEIRDEIRIGNTHMARTASNTTQMRRDLSGIREGDTGVGKSRGKDPLNKTQRRQCESVKDAYRAKRVENPNYSLNSVVEHLIRTQPKIDASAGYHDARALYARVRTEIQREDRGLPPF